MIGEVFKMLRLKNLFPNIDLATMIVKNWDYDNLDLFKYWRISANAIYPFTSQEEIYYLRIAPIDEKSETSIMAELEFLQYLRNNNYTAIQTKPSKNGRELEVVDTPWGKYYAVVFKKVRGKALGDIELTDDIILLWGKALGRLHKLSKGYMPLGQKRCSWKDQINWIKKILSDFPEEKEAIREADILEEFFLYLPSSDDNYGLIHYDFEFDNVFYDEETNSIIPIDFDDSMYHWYAMDVEQAIDSIRNEVPSERAEGIIKQFLDGYRSEYKISDAVVSMFPVFRRFADLYGYVRVLRSVQEKWNNEPEWLEKLRIRLSNKMNKRKGMFGRQID
jgi:Ser/Thr protein kinase RdoA (MazF antagonist)